MPLLPSTFNNWFFKTIPIITIIYLYVFKKKNEEMSAWSAKPGLYDQFPISEVAFLTEQLQVNSTLQLASP